MPHALVQTEFTKLECTTLTYHTATLLWYTYGDRWVAERTHVWKRMAAVQQSWMCCKLTSNKLSWFSVIGTSGRNAAVTLLLDVAKVAVAGSNWKGNKSGCRMML